MNNYKKRDDSPPKTGAAYIRFSSDQQSDSFSLDAQLRQIKDQAERDHVEITKVFSDPAQSAYRKKFRPGINAMRESARQGEFQILYVHKVDRLARRLEWSLEIVHELQELDIIFKAVQQPFDLSTPEGKLLFHLVSSLGEFYSDNLSKETNKGKLERSMQGYHNGRVPWGYTSVMINNRKVGVPDPDKAAVIAEMFERYASGLYSYTQLAEWLNNQGFITNRNRRFSRDTVRDMLGNNYYVGHIRYRGMSVRPKGVSYRSSPQKVSNGQHQGVITQELWERCSAAKVERWVSPKSNHRTLRVHILQSLVVCAHCGRGLRVQSTKKYGSYYREVSDRRGYNDCPYASKSIHAEILEDQIAALIQSLKLPPTWEEDVRKLLRSEHKGPDPEAECKEIRQTLRMMRDNYERGLYEDEEFQYWQKVNALKEKLDLLKRPTDRGIKQAVSTVLNMQQSWEWATRDERRSLVRAMIKKAACDVDRKHILWIQVSPEYEVLFQMMPWLLAGADKRYWLRPPETDRNNCGLRESMGQIGTEVKTFLPLTHNHLTSTKEYVK